MEVPDASEPTGSGTAEPKVEEKTDDEEARGPRHTVAAKDLSVRTLKVFGIFYNVGVEENPELNSD